MDWRLDLRREALVVVQAVADPGARDPVEETEDFKAEDQGAAVHLVAEAAEQVAEGDSFGSK